MLTGIICTDAIRAGARFLRVVNHLSRVILTLRRRVMQTGGIPLWCLNETRRHRREVSKKKYRSTSRFSLRLETDTALGWVRRRLQEREEFLVEIE